MRRILPLGILLAAAILPALAAGHPPAADNHNACLERSFHEYPTSPTVLVQRTLSYLAPLGTSPLPCTVPPDYVEWGSHSPNCPPPPNTGPIPGAYCGPVIPANGIASCTWWPNVNSVPTELTIGFDTDFDNRVNLVVTPTDEGYGTYPPGSWAVPNPYPFAVRVIGYPTNIALPPDPAYGALAPGDSNWVFC